MTEKGWLLCKNARPMLEFLWSAASDRQLRLFACACARRVWDHLPDERSRAAVEAAEEFADGSTDTDRLTRACAAAREARPGAGASSPSAGRTALAMSIATDAARPREDFRRIPGAREFSAAVSAAEGAAALRGLAAQAAGKDPDRARRAEERAQANVMRDMFGSPFRAIRFPRAWRTGTVTAVARQMYESRDFLAMPILADALQDAECDNHSVLSHCRDAKQVHVRGCWVVDLVLGMK